MRVLGGGGRPPRPPRPARPRAPRAPRPSQRSLTLAQVAQRNVLRAVNPQIAALNAGFDRQQQAGTDAIGQATAQMQRYLVGLAPQMASIYGEAQQQQSAADQAVNARLGQVSSAAASGVGQQLAAAGQNAAPFVAPLQQNAAGAPAANLALGTASRSALIGEGAHAGEFAAKQPGIAGLAGTQRLGDLLSTIAAQRADQVGALRARIPGEIESEYEKLQADRFQRQLAQETLGVRAQGAAQTNSLRGATLAERVRHDVAGEKNQAARIRAQRIAKQEAAVAKSAAAAAKAGNARQSAFFAARAKALKDARKLHDGKGGGRTSVVTGKAVGGAKTSGAVGRQAAFRELVGAYGPQLKTQYGYSDQAVRNMVIHVLDAAGYPAPPRPNPYRSGRKPRG